MKPTDASVAGDIAGLHEQIMGTYFLRECARPSSVDFTDHSSTANAAQLFPGIVQTHLDHRNVKGIVKPHEIFAVVTRTLKTKPSDTALTHAVVTYDDHNAQAAAAFGPDRDSVEGALRALLEILSIALFETKPGPTMEVMRRNHFQIQAGAIAAGLLTPNVAFPSTKFVMWD